MTIREKAEKIVKDFGWTEARLIDNVDLKCAADRIEQALREAKEEMGKNVCEHDFGLQVDQECLDTLKRLAADGQAEKVQLYCNRCRAMPYLEIKWSAERGNKEAILEQENKHLRSLIRTQQTEPPFDVADDQTTEMAVRIAALESDLAKEREEKEKLRKSLRQYEIDMEATYAKFARAVSVENQLAYVEAQLLAANERGERMRKALRFCLTMLVTWRDDGTITDAMSSPSISDVVDIADQALTDPKEEIEEPPGIECLGCGGRINPDYGKCTRCK